MTTLTSTIVVNQAIQLIGDDQPPVTGVAPNFDNSVAGKAAAALYAGVVATVARQYGWDFARKTADLTLSGNTAPFPWTYEYLYPSDAVQIWAMMPAANTNPDLNNPLPLNWDVANSLVENVQTKVIQCNVANAQVVYNNNPIESTWDPIFQEAVVRLLASELAVAIAGKPDTAQMYLESGAAMESLGEQRTD